MEVQEEEEGNGAPTPTLEPRQHELLSATVREGDTPAGTVSIHMNFEGSCENFFQPAPPPSDGGARSSAGCAAVASFNLLTPQSIMGLTFVGAAGAAAQSVVNTAVPGAARGERNAELQRKGKYSDNAVSVSHCVVNVLRLESQFTPNTSNWIGIFFRAISLQSRCVPESSCLLVTNYLKTTLYLKVP